MAAAAATVADSTCHAAFLARYRLISASVQGVSHLRAALPCQDRSAYALLPTGELVVVVADGAGSATAGGQGAQWATASALDQLGALLERYRPTSHRAWRVVMAQVLDTVVQELQSAATAQALPLREFATTLLLVVLTADATIGASIGDCAAVIGVSDETADGEWVTLCPPQRGEYANTTNFVTQAQSQRVLAVHCWPAAVDAVALFSDGLAPLAMNLTTFAPHAPFFQPLFAFVDAASEPDAAAAQLAEFLNTPRVNARTDDDKTLVLVRRVAGS